MLAKRLGEEAEVFDPRRLEILIRRLRNKVEQATEDELPLTTVYGLGFNFTQPLRKQ
jgi:DNA-binding response OmpR family regulator